MSMDLITTALDRIEARLDKQSEKLDKMGEKLDDLAVSHARLEEKFLAHDKLEVERRQEQKDRKVALTWPLLVTLVGAIVTAWAPTFIHFVQPTARQVTNATTTTTTGTP